MTNYWYDHVHLISPDPFKTAQFYERIFQAKRTGVTKLGDGRTMIELNLNGARIMVLEQPAQVKPIPGDAANSCGLDHFGIRSDNIEATVAALKEDGVQFRDEIREARPGVRVAFFWGPENVLIELVERKG